jgi:hypothetical protein
MPQSNLSIYSLARYRKRKEKLSITTQKKVQKNIRSLLLRKILWNFKGERSNINTKAFCLPACLTKICHLVHNIEKQKLIQKIK